MRRRGWFLFGFILLLVLGAFMLGVIMIVVPNAISGAAHVASVLGGGVIEASSITPEDWP